MFLRVMNNLCIRNWFILFEKKFTFVHLSSFSFVFLIKIEFL